MFLSVLAVLSFLYWLAAAGLALRTAQSLKTIASLPEPTRTTWPTLSIVIPSGPDHEPV